jgi:hypothetical protein
MWESNNLPSVKKWDQNYLMGLCLLGWDRKARGTRGNLIYTGMA